ncbi:Ig-like domain-containing protein [Priestia megaterium]|uniref:tandem-95 repeat protein n=1 Tax=Priestia megaterium TaxID=1404 RepID=UPI00345774B0
MPYVNRFLSNANGAITFTGNTFGLNKQNNANAPGTAGAIGTFFSVNPSSIDGSFPTGTTADWTQNSSSAILRLPSTTTSILYAELIWGGSYNLGGENVSAFLNNPVTLRTPNGTFSVQSDTITRNTLTTNGNNFYVRSANVTSLISSPGTHTVLGVPGTQATSENSLNCTGWTLAVIYADPLQKSRNLSLFVGAELTSTGTGSSTATVSGFGTPVSGLVEGRLLVSAIEGDPSITGDQLQFGPSTASLQAVSGPNNPITNFFASQINGDTGTLDTTGTFGNINSVPGTTTVSGARQGWDITNINVSSFLQNNQSSAVVRGTTSGDTYVLSTLGIQVDINAPVINVSKSSNVSSARVGDVITYTVQVSNTGTAVANSVSIQDSLSNATSFIPQSVTIGGVVQAGADVRNGVSLGTLGIGQSVIVTYQVRVSGPLTNVTTFNNQALITYQFQSTPGNQLTGSGASSVNSVTAVNTPPTVPNYTVTNPEDTVAVGQVVGADVDGNPLTYQLGTPPANGTVTVNPNGQFTYTPNLNFNGPDPFTVIVSDGQGGIAVSTVTIINTPVNDSPVTQDYNVTTNEDTPLIGAVTATDPDSNSLTFTLQDPPSNGTTLVNPNGAYIYTPNPNFNGIDQFTVLVSDGLGGTAVSRVRVTVLPVNDPPTVPNYTFTTQEDSPVEGAVVGADPDGNPLIYALNTPPANGTVVVNTNGTFIYRPNANFNGTDQFTVLVSDRQGGTAISTVTINVLPVNDNPITGDLNFAINEDTILTGQVTATDPDGNPLTFSLQNPPVQGTVNLNPDGTFVYTPNLNYTGTDTFTVLVSDGLGGSAISTVFITILPVNDSPVVPNYTFTTQEDSPLTAAVIATDVDGNLLTYALNTPPTNGITVVNSDGTFVYTPNVNFNGTDQFTVLVSDGLGGTALSTVTVNVLPVNDPPITGDLFFTINEDTVLTNQVIATDPDGNSLTFTLQNPPINGTTVVNLDGTFTYTPNPNYNGTDLFTVLVSDGLGGTALSTVNITILPVNDPPLVPNYTFSTQEDSSVVGNIVATDIDGNPLTYSLQNLPANGTAVVNADGSFSYTPNLNFNGIDVFTVLVSDGLGGTAVSTVTINVIAVNDPPVTSDLSFTINEDTSFSSQISASDPEGDSLTFTLLNPPAAGGAVLLNADGTFIYTPALNYNGLDQFSVLVADTSGASAISTVRITILPVNDPPLVPNYTFSTQEDSSVVGNIVATDIDGNPLTYSLQNLPANGTAVVNADGSFSYHPNLNFTGIDVFTVLVSDGLGGTALSTVTINVIPVNDAPVTSDLSFTINEDTSFSSQIPASDPEGDPLTFTLLNPPAAGGTVLLNADGTFIYTPALNYNGLDQFSVLVADTSGASAISTVRITILPVNDPPVVGDRDVSTTVNIPITSSIPATNPDGGTLTYTIEQSPAHGTVTLNADGTFLYTPNLGFTGTDVFTVLVTNTEGLTGLSTVTVAILASNGTTVADDLQTSTNEDTPLTSQIIATNSLGNPLIYTIQNQSTNGTVVINSATGEFTYTPNPNFNGMDAFTVYVTDNAGGNATSSVVINVIPVNDPPTVPNYSISLNEDTSISLAVIGTDIDGNSLTYSLQAAPENGIAVVNPDGTYVYTPNPNFNGMDVFTVLVSDGLGGTAVSIITATVLPIDDPPIAPNDISLVINQDTVGTGQIAAIDPDGEPLTYILQDLPTFGTAVVNPDGTFTYTPLLGYRGADTFTVRISDPNGTFVITNVNITVLPVNQPPAVPNYSISLNEDTSISLAIIGTDIDGNPLTYSLQTPPTNGTATVNPDGTYVYTPNPNFNGIDVFTVLVSDGLGGAAVSTITATVLPIDDPPIAPNDISLVINQDTVGTGQIAAIDPDGEPLTYILQDLPTFGTAVVNPDGTFTYTPLLGYRGADTFTVRISDPNGTFVITNVNITVLPVNQPPVVPNYQFTINQDTNFNGAVSATDIDGNLLTYSLNTAPTNGTASVNTDGTYTYIPAPSFFGNDSFTVLVSDGSGGTAISTVSLTVLEVNKPPVAPSVLEFTTNEDTVLNGAIPASDPNGDPLTYTLQDPPQNGTVIMNPDGTFVYTPNPNFNGPDHFSVRIADTAGNFIIIDVFITVLPVNDAPIIPDYQYTINEDTTLTQKVVATHPDGDLLTYQLGTPPANGTAVVNLDGTFTYTPNPNFNGVDTFTIIVSDPQGDTATSTLTINVTPVNDPPIAPSDISLTTLENTPVSSQIIAIDPDGEQLTYTLQDLPDNGTAVVNPNGSFTYTPNSSFTGNDSFDILITDPSGNFAIVHVTVTITPIQRPPVVPNYGISTPKNTPVSGQVIGTDPNGEQLTYVLGTAPASGTASINLDGTYVYTPNPNFVGTDTFTVIVQDTSELTATSTVTVTVFDTNNSPVTNDLSITTPESTSVSGQIPGVDPEGDPIIFSLSGPPFNGTAVVNPDGSFTYTPNPNFVGVDSFAVQVRDSRGAAATSVVLVDVTSVNQAPAVTPLSVTTPYNTSISAQVTVVDPEGDSFVVGIGVVPLNGRVIVNSDGSFTYTPNSGFVGTDSFSVVARDVFGNQGFGSVIVQVLPPQTQPISALGGNLTTVVNIPVSGTVMAISPEGLPITYSLGTPPLNGAVSINPDGSFVYTPNLDFVGEDLFTIVATDSNGDQGIASFVITITPTSAQITTSDYELAANYNVPVSGQVVGFDISGSPITYTLSVAPANGTVIVNSNGTFTYTPNLGYFGEDQFQVLLTDLTGGTAVSTVSITVQEPVNQAPIATNQNLTAIEQQPLDGAVQAADPQGRPLTFTLIGEPANGTVTLNADGTFTYTSDPNFLGNDSFVVLVGNTIGLTATSIINITVTPFQNQIVTESLTLTTGEGQPVSGQVQARDQLGRPLSYTPSTNPLYGTVSVNADGTFTYTPNPGFSGQDQFTVLVQNDQGDQAIAPVTIVVTKVQDVITVQNVNEQTRQNESVSSVITATDALGSPLRFFLNNPPLRGTAIVNLDGTFTYTPNPGFYGNDSFTVLIQNERGDSSIGVVNINVQQAESTISVQPLVVSGIVNQSVPGQVIATDSQGSPLKYTLSSQPQNGTLVFNSDGSFVYTPNFNFAGIDFFNVTVTNDLGVSVTTTVTVVISNPSGEIQVNDSKYNITTGSTLQGQIQAIDTQDRPLTYLVETSPANGILVLDTDGSFTYTPNLGFTGEDQFVVLVKNNAGQQAFATVTVNVLPTQNEITPITTEFVTSQDTPLSATIIATNLLGRPLTYTLNSNPSNGTVILDENGSFVYTPNAGFSGIDTFTVLIRDDLGNQIITTITIAVRPSVLLKPIINNQTFVLRMNEMVTCQIAASDPQSLPIIYSIVRRAQHGTAQIDPDTGSVTYIPNPNFVGIDKIIVQVTNAAGLSSQATITFIVRKALIIHCCYRS